MLIACRYRRMGEQDREPVPTRNQFARRQRAVLFAAVACVLLSLGGLIASLYVKSPQQRLAESQPPAPSVLTATVERRVLTSTIVSRGIVAADTTVQVTPVVAGAAVQVVTAVQVNPGDEIHEGQVLLAVSSRPLIVLGGSVPAYRDLKPGDSGTDVKQLQAALSRLGLSTAGESAGVFGAKTKTAVRKLYQRLGYDPADTGGVGGKGDQASLKAAADAVAQAQDAVDAVRRRINAGQQAAAAEKPLPLQLADLQRALDAAVQAQSDLIASTGTMLPLSEFVFLPSFPARIAAFSASIGDPVKAPLIELSCGKLTVRFDVPPDEAKLMRPGMKANLMADALSQSADGKVASIGDVTTSPSTDDGHGSQGSGTSTPGTPHRTVTIKTNRELPTSWAAQDVRVTITSAQTDAPVLVVPLTAVSSSADGRTIVSVLVDGDRAAQVEVRAGASADGFVEISPTSGTLHEGDKVIIGAEGTS